MIELLKNWKHEGGRIYKKGEILNVHPTDGNFLIKKKIAIELYKIKDNGNSRKD